MKSTRFKLRVLKPDLRLADEHDQIVRCLHCSFVAPMSISYEDYIRLHDLFNVLIKQKCFVSKCRSERDIIEYDPTIRKIVYDVESE
ncbi:hypothetical protein AhnVgp040 [Adoxophyes honmai nucleopolyhedrovirus]|uniref:Uncharacterized protein n=1 Tax=Adoxophyes honmai nucleopolyhedrovirus TaxID=224399 RepID=Q80LQ6_NPVAH|nr:hypothetical protein AhnVgp040 [Adoxophyes honmai nucleopolyhedrovirus]BAC67291.1 hypothetical protein [Adoxophyes honmai nucleopolyhedrovirus]